MNHEFCKIGSYYDALVSKYGHDPRSCDYGRPESQQRKFDVLSSVGALDGSRVLDVGCGFADFADYLAQAEKQVNYTGIDLSLCMVTEAQRLHPLLDIRHGNVLDLQSDNTFDVVFANGIFYLLGDDAPGIMHNLILHLWSLCGQALAFNSLSTWASDPVENEYYADPLMTVAFCRQLTPWIVLRHDYHHRDFTIYMYRELQV